MMGIMRADDNYSNLVDENSENRSKNMKDVVSFELSNMKTAEAAFDIIMTNFDPQCTVNLDGNLPFNKLFEIIQERLKCIPLSTKTTPVIVHDYSDISKEKASVEQDTEGNQVGEGEVLVKEEPNEYEVLRYSSLHAWGQRCPVACRNGVYTKGSAEWAVSYQGNYYLLSSKDAMSAFCSTPNKYLLPIMPAASCKVFVIGTDFQKMSFIAKAIAIFFGAKLIHFNDVYSTGVNSKWNTMREQYKEIATRKALRNIDRFARMIQKHTESINLQKVHRWFQNVLGCIYSRLNNFNVSQPETGYAKFKIDEDFDPASFLWNILEVDVDYYYSKYLRITELVKESLEKKNHENEISDLTDTSVEEYRHDLEQAFIRNGLMFFKDSVACEYFYKNSLDLLQFIPSDLWPAKRPKSEDRTQTIETREFQIEYSKMLNRIRRKVRLFPSEIADLFVTVFKAEEDVHRGDSLRYGGWVVCGVPLTEQLWSALEQRACLPYDVIDLSDEPDDVQPESSDNFLLRRETQISDHLSLVPFLDTIPVDVLPEKLLTCYVLGMGEPYDEEELDEVPNFSDYFSGILSDRYKGADTTESEVLTDIESEAGSIGEFSHDNRSAVSKTTVAEEGTDNIKHSLKLEQKKTETISYPMSSSSADGYSSMRFSQKDNVMNDNCEEETYNEKDEIYESLNMQKSEFSDQESSSSRSSNETFSSSYPSQFDRLRNAGLLYGTTYTRVCSSPSHLKVLSEVLNRIEGGHGAVKYIPERNQLPEHKNLTHEGEKSELLSHSLKNSKILCPVELQEGKSRVGDICRNYEFMSEEYSFCSHKCLQMFRLNPDKFSRYKKPVEPPPLRICIISPKGTGSEELAKKIADLMDCELYDFDDMIEQHLLMPGCLPLGMIHENRTPEFDYCPPGSDPKQVYKRTEILRSYLACELPLPRELLDVLATPFYQSKKNFVYHRFPHTEEDLDFLMDNEYYPDVIIYVKAPISILLDRMTEAVARLWELKLSSIRARCLIVETEYKRLWEDYCETHFKKTINQMLTYHEIFQSYLERDQQLEKDVAQGVRPPLSLSNDPEHHEFDWDTQSEDILTNFMDQEPDEGENFTGAGFYDEIAEVLSMELEKSYGSTSSEDEKSSGPQSRQYSSSSIRSTCSSMETVQKLLDFMDKRRKPKSLPKNDSVPYRQLIMSYNLDPKYFFTDTYKTAAQDLRNMQPTLNYTAPSKTYQVDLPTVRSTLKDGFKKEIRVLDSIKKRAIEERIPVLEYEPEASCEEGLMQTLVSLKRIPGHSENTFEVHPEYDENFISDGDLYLSKIDRRCPAKTSDIILMSCNSLWHESVKAHTDVGNRKPGKSTMSIRKCALMYFAYNIQLLIEGESSTRSFAKNYILRQIETYSIIPVHEDKPKVAQDAHKGKFPCFCCKPYGHHTIVCLLHPWAEKFINWIKDTQGIKGPSGIKDDELQKKN